MKKSHTNIVHTQQLIKERGAQIPVSTQTISSGSNLGVKQFALDLAQVPSPDRSYPAELAGIVYENGIVILIFGQLKRGGGVRSMIEISMSPKAVVQALEAIDAIQPTFAEVLEVIGENPRQLTVFDADPPEVARLKANMVSMGFSGSEVSVDFFDISPFTMAGLNNGATMANVLGVVRVDTQTALVYSLILGMKELAKQFSSGAA